MENTINDVHPVEENDTTKTIAKQFPNSNNVQSASYEEGLKKLSIAFKNGSTYQYKDVPEDVWEEMCNAESVGSFIAKKVKGKFEALKL